MSETTEPRTPVKYTVLAKSLIGNRIYEEGETAEYDGLPAENLAPQCDVGRARYQEYLRTNEERVAKMKADNPESGFGDPVAFQKAVSAAIAEADAKHAQQQQALMEQITAMQASQPALIAAAVAAALAQVFPNGTSKPAKVPEPAEGG